MRDYQIISPSLEGVLNHDSLLYDGIERPIELLRILDGPRSKGQESIGRKCKEEGNDNGKDVKVLESYFHDLYGIFMKKLAYFVVNSDIASDETVKLQAMLQEMIKVKKLMMNK